MYSYLAAAHPDGTICLSVMGLDPGIRHIDIVMSLDSGCPVNALLIFENRQSLRNAIESDVQEGIFITFGLKAPR
jgi:hypothetical protein